MAEQLVFVRQLMVDPHIALVVVDIRGADANVVEAAQGVRQGELRRRKDLVQVLGYGGYTRLRNDIASERHAADRVDDLDRRQRSAARVVSVEQRAQIAVLKSLRGHQRFSNLVGLAEPAGLEIEHEEG